MAKKQTRKKTQAASSGPNWILIGGIVGIAALLLIILVVAASTSGGDTTSTAAVATESAAFATAEADRQELAASGLQPYCEENPDRCFAEGDPNAPVTIYEFSDYGCSHCRDFNLNNIQSIRSEFIEPGTVYWVTIPYGLAQQTGVTYLPSGAAVLCANEQDAAAEFHHDLFEIQGSSRANSDRGFMEIAEALGLDTDAFEECIDDNRYSAKVLENIDLANSIGVRSTPTFVINGELLPGNDPAGIRRMIAANIGG
jgi:protein-disulfide isomerase